MSKNKLISVLSTLSAEEWKELRKYIQTRTGTNSDTYKLFNYIAKNRKNLLATWETGKIHQRLFSSISRKTFLNMMSTLSTWADDWLSTSEISRVEVIKLLSLLKEYTRRGLYDLANGLIPKIESRLSKLAEQNINLHQFKKELYHTLYFSDNPIKNKLGNTLLEQVVISHIHSSIEYNLLYLSELYNRGNIIHYNFKKTIKNIVQLIPKEGLDKNHYLTVLADMVIDTNYNSFKLLHDKLEKDEWDIPSESHSIITLYLIAYSMKFWNQGIIKETQIVTNLYDYGLKTGVLLNNGKIPEIRFHNIISTIGGLSENEWALSFINKWWQQVQSKDPEQNKGLAIAQYYFYNEDYLKITGSIRNVKFESTGQQIRMMGLQIIAWFEERKEFPEMFVQYSTNFKRYLNRSKTKVSDHYHDSHLNLIKILTLLYKNEPKEKIRETLNSIQHIIYRKYLENKLKK